MRTSFFLQENTEEVPSEPDETSLMIAAAADHLHMAISELGDKLVAVLLLTSTMPGDHKHNLASLAVAYNRALETLREVNQRVTGEEDHGEEKEE